MDKYYWITSIADRTYLFSTYHNAYDFVVRFIASKFREGLRIVDIKEADETTCFEVRNECGNEYLYIEGVYLDDAIGEYYGAPEDDDERRLLKR